MTDPCPNPVFDPTPDWVGQLPGCQAATAWRIDPSNLPGAAMLLPHLAAAFSAASHVVLRAFGRR